MYCTSGGDGGDGASNLGVAFASLGSLLSPRRRCSRPGDGSGASSVGAPEMGWDLETGVASMAALAKAAAVAELAAAPKAAVAETPSSPSLAGIFFSWGSPPFPALGF